MTNKTPSSSFSSYWQAWRGPGAWNFYFLVKFGLLWAGYLNFHELKNLAFLVFLLLPIKSDRLHRIRQWVAIPIGFGLFWHDTWLPGPESILSQGSQVAGFSTDYILDLVTRFINWDMVGAFFVLFVGWLFLSQWIRVTVFVVLAMVWLNVLNIAGPAISLFPATAAGTTAPAATVRASASASGSPVIIGDIPAQTAPANSANISDWLNTFYSSEAKRKNAFPGVVT